MFSVTDLPANLPGCVRWVGDDEEGVLTIITLIPWFQGGTRQTRHYPCQENSLKTAKEMAGSTKHTKTLQEVSVREGRTGYRCSSTPRN